MSAKKTSVNLTIDERVVRVPVGTTIMNAAEKIGIRIPRLCYHPQLSIDGACRICVVEVDGMRKLVASCSYPVAEGMVVRTTTPEIRQIRRDITELLLDNHPEDCQVCERDGNCELQRLAYSLGVRERLFSGEKKHLENDESAPGVIRHPDKCVLCHRCVRVCAEVQGVTALGVAHRGFRSNVVPAYELSLDESVCTNCGQCINVCPTAAFLERNRTEEVWRALADPNIHTVVHFAPSVRAAIGEGFGLPPGSMNLEGQTVAALRLLGFDRVFDTQFGADMCTYEEASELLHRLSAASEDEPLPMLTSCSAAWVKFIEQFYPQLLPHLTSTKSPMSILSKLIRTYYAEKMGWDPASIFVVTAMCCTAKKWEAARPQLTTDGRPDTDVVITTRELVWMCKATGIDLPSLAPEKPDELLGESTGAAAIYGATGGVMESALRTAYALKIGTPPASIEFESVRGMDRVREAVVDFDGTELRVAVAHGLGSAHHLMNEIVNGTAKYQYVELMGCPGGCIGGGGQPYAGANSVPLDRETLRKRAEVLYDLDRKRDFRLAHENPSVQRIYADYVGEPFNEKAHELFHTHFTAKDPRGILPPAQYPTPVEVAPPAEACPGGCEERWDRLIAEIERNRNAEHPESALIPVLHAAQDIFGYLPQYLLDFVAYRVGVPAATVYGVATFYHHFSLTAQGQYRIAVCVGTACYINGSARILSALENELGIKPGETTRDGLFSLSEAHCIGACSLAPAILLNGEVHGNLTPEKAVDLVTTLRIGHAESHAVN